ncbi:MAG: hypothetical protein R8P61_35170 [Bacteroidia bacterium]|nr:hypothetical protein [Bacteroidia bacterium]
MKLLSRTVLISLIIVACENNPPFSPKDELNCTNESYRLEGEKVFQSSFDNTEGRPAEAVTKLFGQDNQLGKISSWEGLDLHPLIGEFRIEYQGGSPGQRHAKVLCGAGDLFSPNYCSQGLELMLKSPYIFEGGIASKGNVSAQLLDNTCISQWYSKAQFYLETDFAYLQEWDQNWEELTISEIWNNSIEKSEFPFSIKVDIVKNSQEDLVFKFSGQRHDTDEILWEEIVTDFAIPLKQKVLLELFVKEGDESRGKFAATATIEGQDRRQIIEIIHFTHHPADSNPDGYDKLEPFKLATNSKVLNYLARDFRSLKVHWDNWEFWRNKSYF